MVWLKTPEEVFDHPKLFRLADRLGIEVPQAYGHLAYLWKWSILYAPTGNLFEFSAVEIASAAKWTKDPKVFVTALKEETIEWIKKSGKLFLWESIGEPYCRQKKQACERKRKSRVSHANVTRDSRISHALDKTRLDKDLKPPIPPFEGGSVEGSEKKNGLDANEYSPDPGDSFLSEKRLNFERLYAQYPKKIDPHRSWENFDKSVKNQDDLIRVYIAQGKYLKMISDDKKESKFVKGSKNFYRDWEAYSDYQSPGEKEIQRARELARKYREQEAQEAGRQAKDEEDLAKFMATLSPEEKSALRIEAESNAESRPLIRRLKNKTLWIDGEILRLAKLKKSEAI